MSDPGVITTATVPSKQPDRFKIKLKRKKRKTKKKKS